jgi:endonuclease/exonuclease/phosphatase (EEP) superfamily protein YafD
MEKMSPLKSIKWLLSIPALVSCLFTRTISFGNEFWLLDLTSHFPLQYIALQILGLVLLFRFTSRAYLAFGLAILILMSLNISKVYAYYWPVPVAPPPPQESMTRLKILHMNVLVFNRNYKMVTQLVESTDADIVSLQEVHNQWYRVLHSALQTKGGILLAEISLAGKPVSLIALLYPSHFPKNTSGGICIILRNWKRVSIISVPTES